MWRADITSRFRDIGERQARRLDRKQDRLWDFVNRGPNPGRLRARIYVPEHLPAGAPLVVVLHGCLQSAAEYDDGSGWSNLADEQGFALLFPQQRRFNNPLRGFNWFRPGHSHRNAGEPLSIIQMIEQVSLHHGTDPKRVFVTGLSAGGAMTSVLLATYPEVFAGGAIIAGLPFGAPSSIPAAVRRMKAQSAIPTAQQLAREVRKACDHVGPWPIVSVWHGSLDQTVDPRNTQLIVDQWRVLHGVAAEPTRTEEVGGHVRRVWHDACGREVIEEFLIAGMGHGTPVLESEHEDRGAVAYMLDGTVSSTSRIADFWGLSPGVALD